MVALFQFAVWGHLWFCITYGEPGIDLDSKK